MSATDLKLAQYYERPFKRLKKRHLYFAIGFFSFFYGAFFGVTTIFLLVQLAIPLVLLALLVIWLLPETDKAPRVLLERLFFAFVIALLCWPDYLALALPGLPWITAIRLVIAPLAFAFLLSLSQSPSFRSEVKTILDAAPIVWKLVVVYAILALASIAFSETPFTSLNKWVIAMLYWVMIFFIACQIFAKPGRLERFTHLIWIIAVFVSLIGLWEAFKGAVVWAGHIPSFLKIEDPSVMFSLAGAKRAALGVHRVQSKFTTPLGLAEFLACAAPFVFYLVAFGRRPIVRVLAALTVPLMAYIIIKTDARLGMVGLLSTVLLFALFWGITQWKSDRSSLIGPSIVLSFPAVGLVFFIGTFFVGRLRKLVWGSGAHSFSTEARFEQLEMGLPKILSQPWGYGIGKGGETLGYVTPAGNLTIDSYFLAMALDLGVLGFLLYFAIFVSAILIACNIIVKQKVVNRDFLLLGPITICLINFVVIKSIFSQVENHPFFFAVLGAEMALLYRFKKLAGEPAPSVPKAGRALAGSPA